MTTTSAFASEFFKGDLKWAKQDGPKQYEYSVALHQKEFFPNLVAGVFSGVFTAINAKFDELVSSGHTVDGMTALDLNNDVRALTFPADAGTTILIAWETPGQVGDHRSIMAFTCKPPIPQEIEQRIDTLLSTDGYSIDNLETALRLATGFSSAHTRKSFDSANLDQLIGHISQHGLDRLTVDANNDIRGSYYEFPNGRGLKLKGHGGWYCNMKLALQIAQTFGIAAVDELDFNEFKIPEILEQGKALDLQHSLAALQLETVWEKHKEGVNEIIAASRALDLSKDATLDYGSRSCFVQQGDGVDIYVHENPSRNEQNTFLLALNGPRYRYESLDIMISRPWHADLEHYGIDLSKTDLATFAEYTSYKAVNGGTLPEAETLEAAQRGERPGLVASYNFLTKEFTAGPFFDQTTIFDYLPHMLELDHKALTSIENGDFGAFGSSTISRRPANSTDVEAIESTDIKEWLDGLGRTDNAFVI
jgi:hypothetical protein